MKVELDIPEDDYWSLRNFARSNTGTPSGRVIGQVAAQLPVAVVVEMPHELTRWLASRPLDWASPVVSPGTEESLALRYLADAARRSMPPEE